MNAREINCAKIFSCFSMYFDRPIREFKNKYQLLFIDIHSLTLKYKMFKINAFITIVSKKDDSRYTERIIDCTLYTRNFNINIFFSKFGLNKTMDVNIM